MQPPPDGSPAPPPRRPWWRHRWLPWAVLLTVLIAIVVVRFGELKRLVALVAGIKGTWLALALLLQALTYPCTPLVWQRVLARAGPAPPLRRLLPLALANFRLTSRDPRPPRWALRVRPLARLMALFAETPHQLLRSPALLAFGAAARLAIFVLDAATLAVMLRALGVHAAPGAAFAAF